MQEPQEPTVNITGNSVIGNYETVGTLEAKLTEAKSPIYSSLAELKLQLNVIGENLDRIKFKTSTVRIELPREAFPEGNRDSTSILQNELDTMVDQARRINSEMNAVIGEIEL